MELTFRQRLDRPDAKGRAGIFADLHWAGGHRWKAPTGVKVLPDHWQPAKSRKVHTSAENANVLNLRLTRLQTALESVFLKAEADKRPESAVSVAELKRAAAEAGAGSSRRAPVVEEVSEYLPATSDWQALHDRWQAENQALRAESTLRMLQQCVYQLTAFDPALRIATLTRERLAQYTSYLYAQKKSDNTISRHYWFLRECFQLIGKPVPKWLGYPAARTGRPLSLQRTELLAIAAVELAGPIAEERDAFLFQLLLLLRDSDLRGLRPHHVRPHEIPGRGPWLCAELYQDKTSEPVVVPLPAPAVRIWEKYAGRLPVRSNAHRIVLIKQLGERAGVSREFVKVAFSGKTRHEEVGPAWQFMGTHTARHTGAALLVAASDGDQTLKEIALGHVSASAYGYDTLERYGPLLLKAWEQVFREPGATP